MSSQKLTIVVLGARSAGNFADSYFPTIDCSYLTNITVNNIDTAGQDESFILKEEYIYKFQVLNRQITDLSNPAMHLPIRLTRTAVKYNAKRQRCFIQYLTWNSGKAIYLSQNVGPLINDMGLGLFKAGAEPLG
ncbi:hypothetical protein B0H13DRAFT_1850869 [Mycena leptocephala]|nr:hypothetical protein B0H13DRAFT_1850869 [Mycena leptocephala]